uniref:Beta-lactamase domain-containing protein n=1 Tax=Syphacia muris TaxID=451379 RepID=A0A0N5AIX0_9BILA
MKLILLDRRHNFETGLELAGAAFAVYYKNELVVDIYGGYANKDDGAETLWDQQTMAIFFSITKAISALGLALLIDQGKASYDEYVCKYWPEFAAHGKQNITIRQLLNHQAGLAYDEKQIFQTDDVKNPSKMSEKLEQMVPLWVPGTQCGYHVLTFGFLIDQLVRRIDDKHRGIVEYIEEEIIQKYSITDISIGLQNVADNRRVAKIYEETAEELAQEEHRNPVALAKFRLCNNEHLKRVYENWPWITIPDYNDKEVRRLPMPSNMGIGTARALAQLHNLIVQGYLLSKDLLDQIRHPLITNQMDIINCYPESKGYGWQHFQQSENRWIFGHSGYGGQNLRIDPDFQLVYVYLCNGLKAADGDDVEAFKNLQQKLYECIKMLQQQ